MHKFVVPEGHFTFQELIAANPDVEPAIIRLWLACQVRDREIEIVDGQKGIYKCNSNHE
jgi:hypothetical protein